ncbi:tetratricopeptide repeat protein [Cryomorphaceae bacterium]|nr:tetratricopeptide repeat protein [Cryomorphaceae bacterium]
MKHWIYIVLLFFAVFAQAESISEAFEKGNALYAEEDFGGAIEAYESGLNGEETNAALLYNLGNAYFQNGQLAPAILNYERALLIGGQDEEVARNLAIAQAQRVDEIEPLPRPLLTRFYRSIAGALGPNSWTVVGLWLFLLAAALGAVVVMGRGTSGRRPMLVISALVLLGLSIISNAISEFEAQYQENNAAGIIMAANTYVKSGPDEDAEDLFVLHEGTSVSVREAFSGWVRIRLADGKIGWVPEEDVEAIE